MPPRLLLLSAILSLCSATAGWADEPIRKIEGVQPKATAFGLGGAEKPLVIQSADEAATHFDDKNLATLEKEVDFSKQKVLLFAWRGSGQDRIEFVVLESYPEQVRFSYQRGRTKDLRQHVKVFIIRSNVKCSVNGNPVADELVSDVEIKQNGQWKPTKLPLADLAEGKAVEVRVRGTLTHGIMAIGGETTGTIIRFGKTTWELDLRKNPTFDPAAEKLSGNRVVVTGTVRMQVGVEIAKRTILTVESIGPAVPKDAVLDVIEGQIDSVEDIDDKTLGVDMPPYARAFCIHRDYSPNAQFLMDKARSLAGTNKTVQATIWSRDPELSKANPKGSGVPGPSWVIIKLREVTE